MFEERKYDLDSDKKVFTEEEAKYLEGRKYFVGGMSQTTVDNLEKMEKMDHVIDPNPLD